MSRIFVNTLGGALPGTKVPTELACRSAGVVGPPDRVALRNVRIRNASGRCAISVLLQVRQRVGSSSAAAVNAPGIVTCWPRTGRVGSGFIALVGT